MNWIFYSGQRRQGIYLNKIFFNLYSNKYKSRSLKGQLVMSSIVANPLKLKDLLDYQNGSVVSKTLIEKKTGTVTLFAFDKDQGLSEHTAPFDAMVTVLDGVSEITIDGKLYNVDAGESIIMPANKPHSLKAKNKFKMLLVMIRE